MRFWDSSALVPLIVPEPSTAALEAVAKADPGVAIWWATPLECESALRRSLRAGRLPQTAFDRARLQLDALLAAVDIVPATDTVLGRARALLASHELRAGDALQLAAAFVAFEDRPSEGEFVCLDDRLRDAARAEGFRVIQL